MILTISIFIFALLALGIFFGLRVKAIRKGLVVVPEHGEAPEHITDALNVEEVRNRIRVLAQMWGRRLLLIGLKYSIKTTHYVRGKLDKIFVKIHRRFLHHHNKIVARESASTFLEEIGKHKEEIRKKGEI